MAIKMTLGTFVIPVEMGDFKFEMRITDDYLNGFQAQVVKRTQALEAVLKSNDVQQLYPILESFIDELLGGGAFAKLYQQNPSLKILCALVTDLFAVMEEKIQSRLRSQAALKCVYQKDSIFTR